MFDLHVVIEHIWESEHFSEKVGHPGAMNYRRIQKVELTGQVRSSMALPSGDRETSR